MPEIHDVSLDDASELGVGTAYREFFKQVSGFYPFPYQERLEKMLRARDSVILRVPTGAGKTWAAVAPLLHSLSGGQQSIADRLLYALPLRSLATSSHATVCSGMRKAFGQVATVGNGRTYPGDSRYCSLQIGGQKDDAFFESDIVFTTIDQLLSSYLLLPVSLPDRVGNINAGALIGSIVVFDEVHLLDPEIALGTAIEMLDRLRGLCQFVLMTATTSDATIGWLAKKLEAKILHVPDKEIREFPSQRTKRRSWRWAGRQIHADTVVSHYSGGRTIVLVNTVRRAQDLFIDIQRLYEGKTDAPKLVLLHSRFYPEDRKRAEAHLEPCFGPEATQSNVILVTTQVIEAGIDISADQLHSELAPMNALIQRAGRTARYESRPLGEVIIYEPTGAAPYADSELIEKTAVLLQALPPEGRIVDFAEELAWVETVHSQAEAAALRPYSNLTTRRDDVHQAMDDGNRGRLSALVRDIDSVSLLIGSDPAAHFNNGGWPRLLSVPSISLMRLRQVFQNLAPGDWVAKGASEDDADERPGLRLKWDILNEKQLRGQWLVAIHPRFASYNEQIGLRLGEAGPEPLIISAPRAPWQTHDYQFEPWVDHAQRVMATGRRMEPPYLHSTALLARHYGVTDDVVKELVDVVCVFHDVGKLAIHWQDVAWRWQDDKDARAREAGTAVPTRDRVPLAHTWFGSDSDWRLKGKYPFPPHAVQGAFATYRNLFDHFGSGSGQWSELAAPTAVSAIARHHGAHTRSCTEFSLIACSGQFAAEALGRPLSGPSLQDCSTALSREIFPRELLAFSQDEDSRAFPLYVFLVRRLRLADQTATCCR